MSADFAMLADVSERLRRLYPVDPPDDPSTTTADAGGPPIPLEEPYRSPFPVDALPPLLAGVVEPAAATFGLPAAFYALPLLGTVAGALGNGAELELRPGQRERLILWLACIGRPGSGKSPALDLARQPLDRLQEKLWRAWQDQREGWEALPKEQRPARPVLESVVASDATTEAIGAMLPHSRGLLVLRDELSGWATGMDQYKSRGGADRAVWLALWAGGAVKIDRRSREDPVFAPRPTVSLVGGLTPDALPLLRGEAGLDDGLLDRLLPAWPVARVPRWTEATFPPAPLDRLAHALCTLHDHDPNTPPATIVRLSPAARRVWIAWHDDNAARVEQGVGLAAGFAAKLPRHVPRLALVLHAAADPEALARPLSADTMEAAIELGEYFRGEHGRMLAAIGAAGGTEPAGVSGRVLRSLRRAGGGCLSRTELLDRLRNVPAHRLDGAIKVLEDAKLIECRTVPTATKPREEIRLREDAFEGFGVFGGSGRVSGENLNTPNPSHGHVARIWRCAGCDTPRSRDDRPCPNCGATAGRWFSPSLQDEIHRVKS